MNKRSSTGLIIPFSAIAFLSTISILVVSCTTQNTTVSPSLLGLQTVTTGLTFPLYLTTPPGDNDRLFIVEKTGTIRIIKNGLLLGTPFLDISSLVSTGSEQGLLGLAFDPNYGMNGRFYVSYTDITGNSKIVRYLVSSNPDIAQPSPDRTLLTVNQPYDNHNGGDILFGPDGYLYIGFGDGGSENDPDGHGQNLTDLLGSLLRIDVSPIGDYAIPPDNPFASSPPAKPELWDYGLRNPWRFSFDRQTGDLYIGDVGQSAREEVDVSPAGQGGGKGLNYGWNIMEGTICTPGVSPPNCGMSGLTLPVLDYNHSNGSCAVTGGYVYRGSAIPAIQGAYFYADFCAGWVKSFVYQNDQAINRTDWVSLRPGGNITTFGEDAQGELYILTSQGGVYRIVSQ
jgi:glucose/arabinose dehydrogenase